MKKMLMIALALGLTVALAAPAMATDWSARGHIYVGGAIHKTAPPAGPPQDAGAYMPLALTPTHDSWGDTSAWVRMGANLTITARQSEDLYGVLGFNMNSRRWGETSGFTRQEAGAYYRFGQDDSGTASVLVQEMFIDFRVPPKLPVWLRIGAQPYVIRPWLLVNTVGPGLTGRIMIDPIKLGINAGWAKKWEGYDYDCDDNDAFFVDIGMPIGPVKVGSFFWYDKLNLWLPDHPGALPIYDSGARSEADLWWVGVYADGKIGPIGLQFDWIYGGGSIDHDPVPAPGVRDQDVESWIIRGVLDVSLMNRLTVGIGGLYGTGEDFNSNDSEEFMSVNTREGARQQGLPALQDFLLLHDGVMGVVPFRGPGVGFIGGPVDVGGVWYVRGFANFMATDWLRLVANFGWIGDTCDNGNKFGNGVTGGRQNPAGSGILDDNDDIGFEMDFGFNIALYKNLQWGVGFGYLIAGNALDQWNPITGSNDDPANPWALTSAILYTF